MQGEKLETKHNRRNNQIVHGVIGSWACPVSCSWKPLLKAVLSTTMCEFMQPKCFTRFYQGCRRQSNSKITSFQNKNNNKNPINSFNLSWPVAYTYTPYSNSQGFCRISGCWRYFFGSGQLLQKRKKRLHCNSLFVQWHRSGLPESVRHFPSSVTLLNTVQGFSPSAFQVKAQHSSVSRLVSRFLPFYSNADSHDV